MSSVEHKLKICTGHEWREIRQSYIDFRLQNNKSRPQMCVFTPDDITKQRARLFIPEHAHSHELHNPALFVEKYLAKAKVGLPAIKVDLDSIPGMTIFMAVPNPPIVQGITLTLKLDGDLVLKNKHSSSSSTMSVMAYKKLSLNAQVALNEVLAKLSANYDVSKKRFTLSGSSVGEFVSDDVSFTTNTFTASMTPKPVYINYKDWVIEGQFGYEVEGVVHKDDGAPPSSASDFAEAIASTPPSSKLLAAGGAFGLVLIIFSFV
jgi:hypothetical protein